MYPFIELNLRDRPNGSIVGQASTDRTFVATGQEICLDGYRWIEAETLGGEPVGWLAEADAEFYYLVPGVPEDPAASGETPDEDPTGNSSSEESSAGDNSTDTGSTDDSGRDPSGNGNGRGCDPATGAGCSVKWVASATHFYLVWMAAWLMPLFVI